MRCTLCILVTTTLVAGCATVGPISDPPYYPPNPTAVLLQHQGEIRATATASARGETVTGAYALTPHFGIVASGSATIHKSDDPNRSQYSGELGVGIFDPRGISRDPKSSNLVAELYGGIGWGMENNRIETSFLGMEAVIPPDYTQISGNEQTRFATGWIQGATGYSRDNLSFLFLLRVSDIYLYHDLIQETVSSGSYGYPPASSYDTVFSRTSRLLYFIPGLEIAYGLDHIQVTACAAMVLPAAEYGANPSLYSVGVSYKF